MSNDKYVIVAGYDDRPEFLEAQTIEKGSGQTSVIGEKRLYELSPADCGIPNRTECWGRRVIDGKPRSSGKPINVTDNDYKGEIEIMPWGVKEGYPIILRYLRGYQTNDLHYQDLVLHADKNISTDDETSGDIYFLRLLSGENVFDKDADPFLKQILKAHAYNKNSNSKNPSRSSFMFWEKDEAKDESKEAKTISAKFEALTIVNDASSDNSGAKLKNLYFLLGEQAETGLKDERLFAYLSKFADTMPEVLLREINAYKLSVSQAYEKAKSYKLIDLTRDGFIALGDVNKEIVGEKIPGKGEDMMEWVHANILDEKAFHVAFKLIQITDKIK